MKLKFMQQIRKDGVFCTPIAIKDDNYNIPDVEGLDSEFAGYKTFHKEMDMVDGMCIFGQEEDVEIHLKSDYNGEEFIQKSVIASHCAVQY